LANPESDSEFDQKLTPDDYMIMPRDGPERFKGLEPIVLYVTGWAKSMKGLAVSVCYGWAKVKMVMATTNQAHWPMFN